MPHDYNAPQPDHQAAPDGVEARIESAQEIGFPDEPLEKGPQKPREPFVATTPKAIAFEKSLAAEWADESVEAKVERGVALLQELLAAGLGLRFKQFWEVRTLTLFLVEKLGLEAQKVIRDSIEQITLEVKKIQVIVAKESATVFKEYHEAFEALEKEFRGIEEYVASSKPEIPATCLSLAAEANYYADTTARIEFYDRMLSRLKNLRLAIDGKKVEPKTKGPKTKRPKKGEVEAAAEAVSSAEVEVAESVVAVSKLSRKDRERLITRYRQLHDKVMEHLKPLRNVATEKFVSAITAFHEKAMGDLDRQGVRYLTLKDEVKVLQGLRTKLIFRSDEKFEMTGKLLGDVWDKIALKQTEYKKTASENSKFAAEAREKIAALAALGKDREPTGEEIRAKTREILDFMKSKNLGRMEFKTLCEEMDEAKKGFAASEERAPRDSSREGAKDGHREKRGERKEPRDQSSTRIPEQKAHVQSKLPHEASQLSAKAASMGLEELENEYATMKSKNIHEMTHLDPVEHVAVSLAFAEISLAIFKKKEEAIDKSHQEEAYQKLDDLCNEYALTHTVLTDLMKEMKKGKNLSLAQGLEMGKLQPKVKALQDKTHSALEALEKVIEKLQE